MEKTFRPGKIGGVELGNRVVRSATWEALAQADGRVSAELIEYALERVRGGVGLFILGITAMAPLGKGMPGMSALFNDEQTESHARLVAAAHEASGRISVQLAHVGAQTTVKVLNGDQPVGPSAVLHPAFNVTPRALTTDEVKQTVEAFGQAAARAVRAGYDLIQIHSAHGYLVDQFLSPRFNRRDDEYGEPSRFLLEVYKAVRASAGKTPVWVKLNLDDLIPDSVTPEIALPAAQALDRAGVDAIEVSAGGPASKGQGPSRLHVNKEDQEAYFLELAKLVKAKVKCPVISVGGFRSPAVMERALAEVDFVSMARPLIREPALINRFRSGDLQKAKCISCNRCFDTVKLGHGVQCWVELEEKKKG